MWDRSRELRDAVVRGLAKVGLVWALAVLGTLFVVMSAHGQRADGGYSLGTSGHPSSETFSVAPGEPPRTAGLALALVVLAGGITVLAIGASRGARLGDLRDVDSLPDLSPELPLAHGLEPGFGGTPARR
jgi:hypothetical protein